MSWGVRLVARRSVAVRISACLMRWVPAWVFETHHLLCDEEHNMVLEGALKLQGYSQLHMKMQGVPHT